jgi:imidazolonepropionase-like amidohydrolase
LPALAELGETLGTIESGKLADVIVVAGDPKDIAVMKRVAIVIKDGVRGK